MSSKKNVGLIKCQSKVVVFCFLLLLLCICIEKESSDTSVHNKTKDNTPRTLDKVRLEEEDDDPLYRNEDGDDYRNTMIADCITGNNTAVAGFMLVLVWDVGIIHGKSHMLRLCSLRLPSVRMTS
eukprot:scaffold810_cov163-Amphora_coffeaeformis.AAC.3